MTGFSFQLIFLFLGFTLTEIKDVRILSNHITYLTGKNIYHAVVEESPKGHDGNYRIIIRVKSVKFEEKFKSTSGKCYIYLKNDSNAINLHPGDNILFSGTITSINSPLNPGEFDFRKYSSIHRIYHQAYLKPFEWKKIPLRSRFNIKNASISLRNKFLANYKNAGINGQEYAVLSALVLGYDDEIDRNIMKAFSASGTLHVLSVSGMHVGIIFSALSALLAFLERRKSTRIIRTLILLISLWFYAMLTGLSPSVIRSAMMFSFILIGTSLNRSSNIYNSLALSALCIFILFDPLMLFEVGLQLSFIAVGGIAYLYPKIYKLVFFKNIFVDKVWALVAVSVAAQAATFAISIYYFHQFPNYFIPANLIIIPLSTIGIFAGIFLLFIGPFTYLSLKAGWLVKQTIILLNTSAEFIEDLPYSVWGGISINLLEMVIIYSILFTLLLFLKNKKIIYLYSLQISCCLLMVSLIIKNAMLWQSKNLLIFSNSSSVIGQINSGYNSWLFYSREDSARALKSSNSYCIKVGLPIYKRKMICVDEVKGISSDSNIYIQDNYILYENYLILNYVKGKEKNYNKRINLDLVYLDKSTFNIQNCSEIKAQKVFLNNKIRKNSFTERIGKEIKAKIFYLTEGSKSIEL